MKYESFGLVCLILDIEQSRSLWTFVFTMSEKILLWIIMWIGYVSGYLGGWIAEYIQTGWECYNRDKLTTVKWHKHLFFHTAAFIAKCFKTSPSPVHHSPIFASWNRLWSVSRWFPVVPWYQLSVFGRRAFSVAGPSRAERLHGSGSFRRLLKAHVFSLHWSLQLIRDLTTMHYLNWHFTYLLTFAYTAICNEYKKAVLSQGIRAMPL